MTALEKRAAAYQKLHMLKEKVQRKRSTRKRQGKNTQTPGIKSCDLSTIILKGVKFFMLAAEDYTSSSISISYSKHSLPACCLQ